MYPAKKGNTMYAVIKTKYYISCNNLYHDILYHTPCNKDKILNIVKTYTCNPDANTAHCTGEMMCI